MKSFQNENKNIFEFSKIRFYYLIKKTKQLINKCFSYYSEAFGSFSTGKSCCSLLSFLLLKIIVNMHFLI